MSYTFQIILVIAFGILFIILGLINLRGNSLLENLLEAFIDLFSDPFSGSGIWLILLGIFLLMIAGFGWIPK